MTAPCPEPVRAGTGHSPVAAACAQVHGVCATDIDEMARLQPAWRLRYDQIAPGHFVGSIQQLWLPGINLVVENLSKAARQRGQTSPSDIGFALGFSRQGASHFHGQRLEDASMMVGRGDELDLTTANDFQLVGLLVSTALLGEIQAQLYRDEGPAWLGEKVAVPIQRTAATDIRAMQLKVMALAQANPALLDDPQTALRLRDAVLLDWLRAVPGQVDATPLKGIRAKQQVVDGACDFVLAHQDQPPTQLDVCRAVGVSPRKLAYCFEDVLGVSPSRYLRAMRLNAVRRDLKQVRGPGVTVHDIAARWGFWHMSAFSADFKRQFGQSPSVFRSQCAP